MSWLTESWYGLWGYPAAPVLLSLAATIAGFIVGSERESRDKPAGLRTLTLVCLGAAVFTMAGYCFTSSTGDSGRVAAQIVTGIGFLGAGVILHQRRIVVGTTTAATIWATASIGMVAGAGYAPAALGVALLVRVILSAVGMIERRMFDHRCLWLSVLYSDDDGKTRANLLRILADFGVRDTECSFSREEEQRHKFEVKVRLGYRTLRELIAEIANLPQVRSVDERPGR